MLVIEQMTSYVFKDKSLILEALTHSSYSNEKGPIDAEGHLLADYERLEFLGDAVIGLIVAEMLMFRFRDASEGKLSRWRSSLVSRKALSDIAIDLKLGDHLLLGRGELRTGGAEKRSILAGALEALVGALYLDGGLAAASPFLSRVYTPLFDALQCGDEAALHMLDKKTHLQERTQFLYRTTPVYRIVSVWGLEHEKNFRVEILIGERIVAMGDGRSKKEAEQCAAHQALEILGF